ncbi:hypothetical protein HHJ81_08315 [Mobiluncus mulieris]|nr:hypothetical protein HMPREF9278_2007 [Mobiluncus mulieris FB024-16]MCU9997050.1 hypothetical protein [Mobiluncus mulieris]MCV0009787.1 hypothetical protein [Mobiluncus mulieris]MCV0012604.1 hypothetical protein [Mobiluncus mulieris]NMW61089.1 hypothetical protein [Mobiluncus mulieris]
MWLVAASGWVCSHRAKLVGVLIPEGASISSIVPISRTAVNKFVGIVVYLAGSVFDMPFQEFEYGCSPLGLLFSIGWGYGYSKLGC